MASWHSACRKGSSIPSSSGRQPPPGGQRRGVVSQVQGGHHSRPHELGAGLRVERGGGGQKLLDPGAGLGHVVVQEPEEPQDAEQVREGPGVVGQIPAHGGGQVARLGVQPLQPLAVPGAA